jgi:hypothetical protein
VARSVPLTPGCTVLAFTDGLVERRDEPIDTGLRRVQDRLPTLGGDLSAERLAALVQGVRDHRRDDDVAALAVRRTN